MSMEITATSNYNYSDYGSLDMRKQVKRMEPSLFDVSKDYMENSKNVTNEFDMIGYGAPQSVKEAWEKAENEIGFSGLGTDENGKFQYIPTIFVLQTEQNLPVGRNNFLGNCKESALQAAKKVLERLCNPLMPENDPEVQALKEKEKLFFETFIKNLTHA